MFLELQIRILERFLKDHVTQEWSNDAEMSALYQRINKMFKYIKMKKSFFFLIIFCNF